MRHYDIRINETDYALDVEEIAHDTFTVHLEDGQLVDVRLRDHQDLAQAQISPQIEARRSSAQAPAARELPAPASRELPAPRPAAASPVPAAAPPVRRTAGAGGASTLTAPMPGVVLSVEVSPGAQVTRGQTLLVLEAMKMKNDIKAERDATVITVHVNAGDGVKHGDLLIEFEVNDGR